MTRIALLGAFLVAVTAHAATDPTAKCQGLKLKAAGQKTLGKVKCHQKALLKGLPVDPNCLAKAESKFVAAVAKADAAGTCAGAAVTLEDAVDACLTTYLAIVTPIACGAGETPCGQTCVDLEIDEANCGACGTACGIGETCQNAQCIAVCAVGDTDCSGVCVDLETDEANCGACGTSCGIGEMCQNAQCIAVCAVGETDCSGVCVDLETDEANCGACGISCGIGETCQNAECIAACAVGETDCSGVCVDLATDEANCGACGTTCVIGETCVGGSCTQL